MSTHEHDPTIGSITRRQEKPKYKPLTINVPFETDTSEIEGVVFSEVGHIVVAMLRTWVDGQKKKESARVPKDSPLACSRCKQQRANHCSLCQKRVCGWCHRPDVDHHGGKVRGTNGRNPTS